MRNAVSGILFTNIFQWPKTQRHLLCDKTTISDAMVEREYDTVNTFRAVATIGLGGNSPLPIKIAPHQTFGKLKQ